MQLNIYETVDELLKNIAEHFVALARETVAENRRFSVALSGGNSPKKLYALLASDAFKNKVEWDRIDFFFGDERYVPHTDEASNFKMVNEVFFSQLNIPAAHIFPINTALTPIDAAKEYSKTITAYFKDKQQRFDLILLGLGDNAHTASLFPYTPVLQETAAAVKAVFLTDQQAYRITLTAPLINLAHHITFLVYGADKANAVHEIIEEPYDAQKFPAQLIKPLTGKLVWYLDKAAASKIKNATTTYR